MGFVDRSPAVLVRPLNTRDYLALAILGSAARGPLAIDEVPALISGLAGPLWSPVHPLIHDAMDEMVVDGQLGTTKAADSEHLRLTLRPSGHRRLHHLLALHIPGPLTAFGQVGVRLKLAFLDLLPPPMRRHQIGALIRAYDCEIAGRNRHCHAWPLSGSYGRQWLDGQMEGLEDSLTLLRDLARCDGES